ncbi:hypothetical protein BGX30_007724 [Mortierella sp. GBA39]|nr:hypothetical protein BGX30_007724 [Mortierella sp. GBA39]
MLPLRYQSAHHYHAHHAGRQLHRRMQCFAGAGFTFSGFTGLPTSTGVYYPIPSGTGGSGSGSNNSNGGSSNNGSSSNTGLYAGIGAGVGVVVLGAALFFWHRSRKNKTPVKTAELPPPPAMQAVHNHHQPPPQPQPPLPAVPAQHQYNYNQPPAQTGYQQQYPDQQNQFPQQHNQFPQQQNQYQQQNHYQPQTVVPQQQQQQQYTSQPPVVTNFYGQAGGGTYPDSNAYEPNQLNLGYYPTASTVAPLPQPVPSPTFSPNDYYQQQQQQQQQQHAQHTFSPVVTTSGIHQQQEPMPMPEQSNPYGLTSPSATTNTTAYSPAMTTSNSTSYETPATTAFAYEAPAFIVPPVAGAGGVKKVSAHGPQVIHVHEQEQAAKFSKNPQYVEPHDNNNAYHN